MSQIESGLAIIGCSKYTRQSLRHPPPPHPPPPPTPSPQPPPTHAPLTELFTGQSYSQVKALNVLITQMKGKAGTLRQNMCFLFFSSVIMSMGCCCFCFCCCLFFVVCCCCLYFIVETSQHEKTYFQILNDWLSYETALLSSNHCTLFYTVHLKKCECVVVVACFDFVQTQPTKGIKSDFFNCLVNILWNCDVFVSRS